MELDGDYLKLAKVHPDSTDGLFPIFHYETRKNEAKSLEAGTNIYERIPYVEIIAPGNDKEKINRRVKPSDKERWPEHWRRFEEGHEKPVFDGMPVTEWPMCDVHLARTLNDAHIYTVEQLAEVPDVDIQILGPGMMGLKNKAREWVRNKLGRSEEIERLTREIETLKEQLGNQPVPAEIVVKNGTWYTYQGKKYRKAELPPEVLEAIGETE